MARRYFTVPNFVQNINIELLDAYFQQDNIPFTKNLRILEADNKPKAIEIEEYINGLEAEKQYQISTDFIEVNEISYEWGILSIIEYGETQGKHVQKDINSQDGYVNQAM